VFLLPTPPKGFAMTPRTDSTVHRILASVRRAWADMDRASRLLVEQSTDPRHR
jgi:hypothetical protein